MEILNQVIDQFGEGIDIRKTGKDPFCVTVSVCLSTTLLAWVFQFVGKMNIESPEYVREHYAGYHQDAIDDALGEREKTTAESCRCNHRNPNSTRWKKNFAAGLR